MIVAIVNMLTAAGPSSGHGKILGVRVPYPWAQMKRAHMWPHRIGENK